MVKGRNQVTLNKWLGKFKSRCLLLRREYLCPTFPSFRGIRHGRGVIAGRCPKSLSPVSGGQAGAKGSRNSPWVIFCFLLVFRPTASSRLSPLWAPGSRAFSTLYALGTQDSSRGTHFFAESGLSGLLNLSRPSAASPRPQPQPHPERLWGAGRGPGRQRNAMVNNRLWMARAPALCVPLRTPDRQPHEAHRGGDQPGVDPVAVQGEAEGRRERHPVLRHPDRDLRGGGCGHHVEGQEGEMEGRIELQVEGPHGRRIAAHLIEAAGFLDRPRRGREAGAFDIDLARLCPLPEGGGGGVDPDRAGGLGLVRPQEVRDQEAGGEVRGRDAEGPLATAVQGGEALLDFEQGLQLDAGQGLDHRLAPGPELFQIPYHLGAAALVSTKGFISLRPPRSAGEAPQLVCYLIRSRGT